MCWPSEQVAEKLHRFVWLMVSAWRSSWGYQALPPGSLAGRTRACSVVLCSYTAPPTGGSVLVFFFPDVVLYWLGRCSCMHTSPHPIWGLGTTWCQNAVMPPTRLIECAVVAVWAGPFSTTGLYGELSRPAACNDALHGAGNSILCRLEKGIRCSTGQEESRAFHST